MEEGEELRGVELLRVGELGLCFFCFGGLSVVYLVSLLFIPYIPREAYSTLYYNIIVK